ncbi:hypothetical protein [Kitasatospora griseola]|uniref:hypothetical protein n=1 Tax=Kitasatospora griseola TaxID=2064 RepID=UPI00380CB399
MPTVFFGIAPIKEDSDRTLCFQAKENYPADDAAQWPIAHPRCTRAFGLRPDAE